MSRSASPWLTATSSTRMQRSSVSYSIIIFTFLFLDIIVLTNPDLLFQQKNSTKYFLFCHFSLD
nr:MAG TPA: hypothetical protein [Caudoviricetes sp.]